MDDSTIDDGGSRVMRSLLPTLIVCTLGLPAQAQYSGGSGTAEDPYEIATAADLIALGETPDDYDKHFILTADIDLDPNLPGGRVFDRAVIAPHTNPFTTFHDGAEFSGTFDGNGHVISNLHICGTGYLGLFGYSDYAAAISNLGLEAVSVIGTGKPVTMQSFPYYIGGLVGENRGSITSSYSTGAVTGDDYVGGLVGKGSDSIFSSFWDIETSGQSNSPGGTGLSTAEMQTTLTFLEAGWDFVDETTNGTCDYWQMSSGEYPRLRYHIGDGPVMPEGSGTAEQPYLIRDARDLGIVWFEPLANYRLEASVDLSVITWSMAIVPWFDGTFDGNGHVIRDLHIQGGAHLGLFGVLGSGAEISNLGLEAIDVNGIGMYVGGLVGLNEGSITASYSTGAVSANNDVGGLVGGNQDSITSSYSTGTVTGRERVGGLVGFNWGSIAASYSTGAVTGDADVGGLVGRPQTRKGWPGSATYCFWNTETSRQAESAGGTGLTTAEMQAASTFLDAGWDFIDETENGTDDIWWILEGQDYPRLWWELLGDRLMDSVPGVGTHGRWQRWFHTRNLDST